jgi:hypothetical protein
MSVEQPSTITIPPSTIFGKLAPRPRPDYSARIMTSSLPEAPTDHVTVAKRYVKGDYPFVTDKPYQKFPTKKELKAKQAITPKDKVPICTDARAVIKIMHNGIDIRKHKRKRPAQPKVKKEKSKKKRRRSKMSKK